MNSDLKKNLLKYGISVGVCVALACAYVFSRLDVQNLATVARLELYRVLCDAFFIPGALILMCALMVSVSNQGGLDGVTYVLTRAARLLIPGRGGNIDRYQDHVEKRRGKHISGYGFLYVVGLIFLAVSLIFWALFSAAY